MVWGGGRLLSQRSLEPVVCSIDAPLDSIVALDPVLCTILACVQSCAPILPWTRSCAPAGPTHSLTSTPPVCVPCMYFSCCSLLCCGWLSVSKGMACTFAGGGCSLLLQWSIAGLWAVPLWLSWCCCAGGARLARVALWLYLAIW
jgi:hypothetical protein